MQIFSIYTCVIFLTVFYPAWVKHDKTKGEDDVRKAKSNITFIEDQWIAKRIGFISLYKVT